MATYRIKSQGAEYIATVVDKATGGAVVTIDGQKFHVEFTGSEQVAARHASSGAIPDSIARHPGSTMYGAASLDSAASGDGMIVAPIPGMIIAIHVKVGDMVSVDQVVLKLEAMKMENDITSPVSGIVKEIAVSEGSEAASGQLLMSIA